MTSILPSLSKGQRYAESLIGWKSADYSGFPFLTEKEYDYMNISNYQNEVHHA
jgi:hypothetical protein